jgi:hypothetical protein
MTTFVFRDQQIVQMGSSLIGLSDEPSGVLVIGRHFDNNFARKLKRLTDANISFLVDGKIVTSSHNKDGLRELSKILAEKDMALDKMTERADYLFKYLPLVDSEGKIIGKLLIQISMKAALATLKALSMKIGIWGGSILILANMFSYWVASHLTNRSNQSLLTTAEIAVRYS